MMPMKKTIPYGKQYIDRRDIDKVVSVLESEWVTQGPKIDEFEKALAAYCGAKYAVAVSSGTAALHIACLAADIGRGDEVITSPITFAASANCVLYCNAKPVFADIEDRSINIDPENIKKAVNKRTKALIPVHFAGFPCDMQDIYSLAKKNKLTVIEDAAHALGAEYKGSKIGSCRYSDMTAFSFHPVKAITTGEGGAVTTNSRKLYEKLILLRNHGIVRGLNRRKGKRLKKAGVWYYEMQELGFNYRITDFQSALGISQMSKIDIFLGKRRSIAKRYNRAFNSVRDFIKVPSADTDEKKHAWHLYVLRFYLDKLKVTRDDIFNELLRVKIKPQVHYIPVYRHPFYRRLGYGRIKLDNAERYYRQCISLPVYPALSIREQDYVIGAVKDIVRGSSG